MLLCIFMLCIFPLATLCYIITQYKMECVTGFSTGTFIGQYQYTVSQAQCSFAARSTQTSSIHSTAH